MDKQIVKTAAFLSELVYMDPGDIFNALPDDYTDFEFIENKETDTQAMLVLHGNIVYAIIRGTTFTNIDDWYTNLDCELIELKPSPGKYHSGFIKDALSVYDDIINSIRPYWMNGYKTCIGGHSQGAAVAKVSYSMFKNIFDYCVTFGEPRSMNKEASDALIEHADKMVSVVNNNDIVTRVPPRIMGYKHTPRTLWYFDHDGNLHHSMTWWEMFKDRIAGRIDDLMKLGTDGVKDHIGSEYVRLVNNVK